MNTSVESTNQTPDHFTWSVKSTLRRAVLVVVGVLGLLVLLFVVNGLWLANNETPVTGVLSHAARTAPAGTAPREIKILAYNIAKGFCYAEGTGFADPEDVRRRIAGIGELVRAEQPDLVFLSESILECQGCPVDQVRMIAEAAGMHAWAFGENFNFGLPFYRIVGGNAILSRWPLEGEANPALAGRQPFYVTKNNRRVLWCRCRLGGCELLLGAIHTDSFNLENNLAQTRQLLDYCGQRPAILAGDFNAQPHEPPIELLRDSGRFSGEFAGPLTFPASQPEQTIDFIFAPAGWTLIEHRAIDTELSDHRPIVATFRLPDEL